MNSSAWHSQSFTEQAEIEFLLSDLWLNRYPLTDYDEWRNLEEVYNSNTPPAIRDFIEGLPAYELPTNLTKENA